MEEVHVDTTSMLCNLYIDMIDYTAFSSHMKYSREWKVDLLDMWDHLFWDFEISKYTCDMCLTWYDQASLQRNELLYTCLVKNALCAFNCKPLALLMNVCVCILATYAVRQEAKRSTNDAMMRQFQGHWGYLMWRGRLRSCLIKWLTPSEAWMICRSLVH